MRSKSINPIAGVTNTAKSAAKTVERVADLVGSLAGLGIGSKKKKRTRGQTAGAMVSRGSASRGLNSSQAVVRSLPNPSSASIMNFPTGLQRKRNSARVEENDEYVAEINGSTGFTATQYPINPGQSVLFPWLSKIAVNFEKYKFHELIFYYKPEVSAFATQGQSGKVMLSCDYDSSDAPPATKQQVEDTYPHADGMPYETIALNADPKQLSNELNYHFVRSAAVPGGSDIKTYDCGAFYASTFGNTNTSLCGELRVRYKCELTVPILQSTSLPNLLSETYLLIPTSINLASAQLYEMAMRPPAFAVNGCNVVLTNGNANATIPSGRYKFRGSLQLTVAGDVFTAIQWQIYDLTNGATMSGGGITSQLTVLAAAGVSIVNLVVEGFYTSPNAPAPFSAAFTVEGITAAATAYSAGGFWLLEAA